MMNFGYNNRWVRLVKDILFAAFCIWLISRTGFFAVLLGVLGLFWYRRDACYRAKVMRQDRH